MRSVGPRKRWGSAGDQTKRNESVRILVTGSAGLIGRALLPRLTAESWTCRAVRPAQRFARRRNRYRRAAGRALRCRRCRAPGRGVAGGGWRAQSGALLAHQCRSDRCAAGPDAPPAQPALVHPCQLARSLWPAGYAAGAGGCGAAAPERLCAVQGRGRAPGERSARRRPAHRDRALFQRLWRRAGSRRPRGASLCARRRDRWNRAGGRIALHLRLHPCRRRGGWRAEGDPAPRRGRADFAADPFRGRSGDFARRSRGAGDGDRRPGGDKGRSAGARVPTCTRFYGDTRRAESLLGWRATTTLRTGFQHLVEAYRRARVRAPA